jgi:hypothetical protein
LDSSGYLVLVTPDHSTLSRTRRLIDLETHLQGFTWVLGLLAKPWIVTADFNHGLLVRERENGAPWVSFFICQQNCLVELRGVS